MRKSVIIILALAAFGIIAGEAWAATILTREQVISVCGSGMVSGGTSSGCKKPCGTKTCEYSCTKGKDGKQTCEGNIYLGSRPDAPKGKAGVPPKGGILERDSGFPTQGPSRTGTPAGAPSRGSGTIY